jgi:uncharacterized protein YprB with RNaseH-like and TPR domain
MKINPHIMKKKELVEYMSGRCKHNHLYSEHPNCFLEEKGKELRIGIIDIETSNLNATFGIILTYAIKVYGEDDILFSQIEEKHLRDGTFDKALCKQLVQDMLKFDLLIGYYNTKYDIPYIRSRCLANNIDFPIFKTIDHKDLYYMVKRLLKLHRNSLEVATSFLGIKGKNHVMGKEWNQAVMCNGEKFEKAIAYILDHNIKDVCITEKLYRKLKDFDRGIVKSI